MPRYHIWIDWWRCEWHKGRIVLLRQIAIVVTFRPPMSRRLQLYSLGYRGQVGRVEMPILPRLE